jgi:hypothetical protein
MDQVGEVSALWNVAEGLSGVELTSLIILPMEVEWIV